MNRLLPITSAAPVALALAGLALSGPAPAQPAAGDPFVRDATAGLNARTFYMDVEDRSKPPATTEKAAWAIGGKLFGRTGYWADSLQLGASYYLSAPLYAPDDKDGTGLLAPGQSSISVLGELYARLKFGDHRLTVGRQEIDLGYPRASGVRGNRSDATYVGRQDNRMVPVTYESALLGGRFADGLNYHVGWVGQAKPRNADDFVPVGEAIGAKGSDAAMWMGGLQYSPAKDFWIQGWYHVSSDVLRIAFVDADYVMRLSTGGYLRLAGQVTDQRSDGSNALTGKPFSTRNAQAYAEFGSGWLTVYGALGRTGSGADLRMPFTSGPVYTAQITRSFVRAHESAIQLGLGADLGAWIPGVTGFFDVTSGKDAIHPDSGAKLADAVEYDLGAVWTIRQKGAFYDGLRTRLRSAWVVDGTSMGDRTSTDLRLDINLPLTLR